MGGGKSQEDPRPASNRTDTRPWYPTAGPKCVAHLCGSSTTFTTASTTSLERSSLCVFGARYVPFAAVTGLDPNNWCATPSRRLGRLQVLQVVSRRDGGTAVTATASGSLSGSTLAQLEAVPIVTQRRNRLNLNDRLGLQVFNLNF